MVDITTVTGSYNGFLNQLISGGPHLEGKILIEWMLTGGTPMHMETPMCHATEVLMTIFDDAHQSIGVDIAAIFGFHAGVDCYINHIYNDNLVQTVVNHP